MMNIIIGILLIIAGILSIIVTKSPIEKTYHFNEHTLIQKGNYIYARFKVPENCEKLVAADVHYEAKGIVVKR